MKRNKGSISAFVVCSVLGLVALTGLVFDGGRVISEYSRISDFAENAARIGCQQLVGIRSGHPRLDPTNATTEIYQYLRSMNLNAEVDVQSGGARVRVRQVVRMKLLSLFGIASRTISVTRSAHVVSG